MSSELACSHKLYLADCGAKGVPTTYKNLYKEFDEHALQCDKIQNHLSTFFAWKRYHPKIDASGGRHKLFDAGCGTGLVVQVLLESNEYSRQDLDLYGGDYSNEMLSMAREKNIYDHLEQIDLKEELPYGPETFDSIVSSGVFLQGHCGPECIPNVIRVLKKGCYFITTVRTPFYMETKEEWDQQIPASGAVLLEAYDAPYNKNSKGLILVMQKN